MEASPSGLSGNVRVLEACEKLVSRAHPGAKTKAAHWANSSIAKFQQTKMMTRRNRVIEA